MRENFTKYDLLFLTLGLLLGGFSVQAYHTIHKSKPDCNQVVMKRMSKENTDADREIQIMYLAQISCEEAKGNPDQAMALIENLKYNH